MRRNRVGNVYSTSQCMGLYTICGKDRDGSRVLGMTKIVCGVVNMGIGVQRGPHQGDGS